ncbi:GEVED domain-containing protein [Flavobacterium sp.]|uniref:GEVED domain-containing protein n=1 Tax=Flavobacterium sp. TaxID=239 RepID=UPI002A82AB28|nr:GEVED domain-containing protein [Flavobacterium sp.]
MTKNYTQSTKLNLRIDFIAKSIFSGKTILAFLFILFGIQINFAQSPNTYTTSGTWLCPQGVTSVKVEAWGGGAGGASTPNTNNANGGGGGGGAYSVRNSITVVPGTTYNFTIGTGGGQNANGNNTTAIINGVTITAAGGSTGASSTTVNAAGGVGGTVAASVGDTRYAGGNGANGVFKASGNNSGDGGGGGSGAGTLGAGNNGVLRVAGALRANFGGAGGTGGLDANGTDASTAAGNYGGGGGGAGHKNNSSGLGARGAMIFTYTCPALVSNAGPNQTLAACATTATLAANTPVNSTGAWTVVSGTGTVTTLTSPTSGVTGIVPGGAALVLRWTVSNGLCGSTFSDVSITSPIGPGCLSYCTPTGNLNCTLNDYISNVTLNTLNNNTTCNAGGYTNFPKAGVQTTSVIKGSSYNLSLTVGAGTGTHGAGVWIDFNQNGSFSDAGEFFLLSNAITPSSTTVTSIAIPIGAASGDVRMRIRYAFNITVVSGAGMSCTMAGTYGETEDYTITLVAPAACVAPTAQATALILTPSAGTINGSFTAASPASDSYLVVMNTTGTTPTAPVNGTSYSIGGTLGAGNTIVDNDTDTVFSATGLAGNTTYYFFIYSFNGLCTGGPLYYTTSPRTGNATTPAPTYCVPVHPASCSGTITNVIFNTINNTSGCADTHGVSYTNYSIAGTPTTNLSAGSSYNLNVTTSASSIVSAWIDFNQDGTFAASEWVQVFTTGTNGVVSFAIPIGATSGNTRMRIRSRLAGFANGSGDACTSLGSGETEDYRVTIIPALPCAAPTAQPTAIALTAQATILSGSFTPAVPAANSYLVVMSTSAVAPAGPVNGTTYAIGSTIAPGYTVVDNDSNPGYSVTGLTPLTTYYFYIYSVNNFCTGGPLYLVPSPLTGNITTGLVDYCVPTSTVSTRYIDDVSTVGYITNITNMVTGRAASGYADYTALPPVTQIPGGGVTLDYRLAISRQFVKVWVDWNNDGTFTDALPELVYNTGGVQTIAGSAGFVIPPATLPGNYRVRIRTFETSQTFGPCGNLATGETEDYRLTVVADCTVNITGVTDGSRCDTGTVVVGATATAGTTQYRYYSARTGGTLVGTSPTTSWTTPSIAVNTSYYVTAWNGVCESWYRTEVKAIINPTTTINVTPSTPEVCGENNVVTIAALGDVVIDYLVDENFEGGGFGVLTRTNVAADANTQWTNRTSPYVPTGSVWKPAITSRTIGNRFALSVSDFAAPAPKDTQLRTVALNTTAYSTLTLSFRHYFSYYVGEPLQFADVDVSTNGGAAWTNIASYTSTEGFAGKFNDVVFDVSAYAGLPSVMFRFRYQLQGSAFCDGWAIDDVKVYGTRPLNTTFSWSGGVQAFIDFPCTIPYVAQSVTTIYVKPNAAQLELPTYSFTASATLGNGCPVSKLITINNKSSVWKGGTSNDWNNPNNWAPVGVPTINTCVIIPDVTATNPSRILGASYNAFGKTLQVKNLGNLQILPTNTLTIADYVDVTAGGTFNIENSASLIQINNNVNTGVISMKRNVNLRKLDYVYWSSPVANFPLTSISTTIYRYKWTPTIGANLNGWGNWAGTSENMVNGKGYIVRGPDSYTTALANYTANFTGVPNNGIINMPISRGTYNGGNYSTGVSTTLATRDDDNWNLIGNPYPSAVNANLFLAANTNIAGYVKYWTHGTLPSAVIIDPFYNDYVLNYTVGDYVTYNATGANPAIGNGNIAAGQGFFVLMNHTSAGTTENVVFNNTMRRNDYRNDLFFRDGTAPAFGEEEKHRIWLNLISPSSNSTTTLIGYVEGASNDLDRMYDAQALDVKTDFELFSFSNTDRLTIQGRSLPFNQNDEVTLGVSIPQNGIYTIAINNVDGLFSDTTQKIYLEDKQLGIFHDLRTAPYTFTGTTGRDENRFVLLYNSSRLSQEDVTLTNNLMVVSNENVTIHSSIENINSIEVHDLLGKIVKTYNNIDAKEFMLNNLQKNNSTLLLRIKLNNGAIVDKKIIF